MQKKFYWSCHFCPFWLFGYVSLYRSNTDSTKRKSHRLPHKKHPMIHIKMLRFGLFLDGQFLGSYFATFAGKTSSRPRLFSKDLALKDLPRLYKAADAFVLPTRGVRRLAMENKYHPDESSFRNMKNLYMRHSKSFFLKNGPCSLGCENSILGGGVSFGFSTRETELLSQAAGEGWGRPHVEAMSMELPVIATNWSGSTAT